MLKYKSIFLICINLLSNLKTNVRAYIGFSIGAVVSLIFTFNYLNYSISINEPINAFEPYIMMGSLRQYMISLFFGLFCSLSDAPYITKRTQYTVIRVGRMYWALGCIIYILCVTILYYTFILILTVSVTYSNSTFINAWSQPMYILAHLQSYNIYDVFKIYFRYPEIIKSFLPCTAALNTFVLLCCFSVCMITLMYVINLHTKKYMGTIVSLGVNLISFMFLSENYQKINNYLPLTNALLSRYNVVGVALSNSVSFSVKIFLIIFIIFIVILINALKINDFESNASKYI